MIPIEKVETKAEFVAVETVIEKKPEPKEPDLFEEDVGGELFTKDLPDISTESPLEIIKKNVEVAANKAVWEPWSEMKKCVEDARQIEKDVEEGGSSYTAYLAQRKLLRRIESCIDRHDGHMGELIAHITMMEWEKKNAP